MLLEISDFIAYHPNKTTYSTIFRLLESDPDHYIRISTNRKISELTEIVKWCDIMIKSEFKFSVFRGTFCFTNPRDAMVFKLAWM